MATVSVSLPSDGQTIDAADYNTPINTIVTELNGSLDSDNIAEGGVVPNSLVDGTGTSWVWQTWTPNFTNLSGGTLNYSKYTQTGKTVKFKLKYTMTGANVSGEIIFSTPVTTSSDYDNTLVTPIDGVATFRDSGTITIHGAILWVTTTTLTIRPITASGTYASNAGTSSTVPFTWASGDVIYVEGSYEAA